MSSYQTVFMFLNETKIAKEDEFNYGLVGAALSCVLFMCNSRYLLPNVTPLSASSSSQKAWKWRNTVNSLIHSTVTGCGALFNLWVNPDLRLNLISVHTLLSLFVNSITVGYFIYDFVDLVLNNLGKKNTRELLLHHAMVTVCFGLALVTRRYQGYAMVSLLLEVNSIFLHIRQLCILHELPKNSTGYKIVSYTNIGTFVVFRLLPLSWQVRWLADHKDEVPNAVVTLGFITSAIIMVLNLGLLVQIVKKDFILKEHTARSHTE